MPTAEQCNAYAAEYRLLVQQVDVSIRRAASKCGAYLGICDSTVI